MSSEERRPLVQDGEYPLMDPRLIRLQVLIPLSLLVSMGAVLVATFVPDRGMGQSVFLRLNVRE
jgi:hypothetical protein